VKYLHNFQSGKSDLLALKVRIKRRLIFPEDEQHHVDGVAELPQSHPVGTFSPVSPSSRER